MFFICSKLEKTVERDIDSDRVVVLLGIRNTPGAVLRDYTWQLGKRYTAGRMDTYLVGNSEAFPNLWKTYISLR